MPFRRPFGRRMMRTRRVEWIGGSSVTPTSVAVNALSAVQLLSVATLEEFPRGSIQRLLFSCFVSPATAPAAASGYGVFLGLTWAYPSQSGIDPEINLDHRWTWWQCCFPQIGGTGVADANASRWIGYFRFDVDTHAMRKKFQTDESPFFMLKNSNSSAAAVQFSYAFRSLIMAGH